MLYRQCRLNQPLHRSVDRLPPRFGELLGDRPLAQDESAVLPPRSWTAGSLTLFRMARPGLEGRVKVPRTPGKHRQIP